MTIAHDLLPCLGGTKRTKWPFVISESSSGSASMSSPGSKGGALNSCKAITLQLISSPRSSRNFAIWLAAKPPTFQLRKLNVPLSSPSGSWEWARQALSALMVSRLLAKSSPSIVTPSSITNSECPRGFLKITSNLEVAVCLYWTVPEA